MRFFLLTVLATMLFLPTQAQSLTDDSLRRGRLFFLPVIYYTPETGLGFGARTAYTFRDRAESRPSNLPATLIYTTEKQLITGFAPDLWLRGNAHHVYGQIGYLDYPFKFYGIGNSTPESIEEPYTTRIFDVYAGYERRIVRALYAGVRLEAREENIVERTGLLATGQIPGSAGQSVAGAGLTLTNDSRDDVFFPGKGFYNQLQVLTYRNRRSDFNGTFQKIRLDLRRYQPIGRGVLALNTLLILTPGDPTFQYLALIGGEKIMRGYFAGRYRDRNLLVFQGEYRFPISKRFKVVAFASTGRVWSDGNFELKDFHPAGGAGLRYRVGREKLHLRFDLAYGQALYPYFGFTEAF
ncbi:MAG: BamA/TamA family outer membrane protein [Cytophagaceae bacterium]|nr:BamA/TamA family outer membrane protein [Cytophagaceae bacterium]